MGVDRVTLSVLVADDHPMFRMGLRMALLDLGFGRVDEAVDGRHALDILRGRHYDVLIVDLMMPNVNGVQVARSVAARAALAQPRPVIVMLSSFDEPAVIAAARDAGVASFVGKETEPERLARHIDDLVAGRPVAHATMERVPALTVRESTVLRHLVHGATSKDIGVILGISPETVKDHLRGIYTKLNVGDRVAAIAEARRLGLILLDEIGGVDPR